MDVALDLVEVGETLGRLANWHHKYIEKLLRQLDTYGLPFTHAHFLMRIGDKPFNACNANNISFYSHANCSYILKRLVENNLIAFMPGYSSDKRERFYQITEQGKELRGKLYSMMEAHCANITKEGGGLMALMQLWIHHFRHHVEGE